MSTETVSIMPADNEVGPWVKYLSTGITPVPHIFELAERIEQIFDPNSSRPVTLLATLGEILFLNPPNDNHTFNFVENEESFKTTQLLEAQKYVMTAMTISLLNRRKSKNSKPFEDFLIPAICEVIGKDVTSLSKHNQDKVESTRYAAITLIDHIVHLGYIHTFTGGWGVETRFVPFAEAVRRNKRLEMALAAIAFRGDLGAGPDSSWAGASHHTAFRLSRGLQNSQLSLK